MAYQLLTGATGLLGSYLLRDGLRLGRRMAVLVRRSRSETARQRVESILARYERESGETLARPVIFEGDLSEVDLGLDGADLRWIERHCDCVVHNAASLTFKGADREGEPWRSNVLGTRKILDLCQATGIRRFHHVSTAYVCGLREGLIREDELDVGQQMGNDYERSKVEAETLVRQAKFLDSYTVYRPGIIVGDSRSGFTTTFHGFYASLKLAHTLVSRVPRGVTAGRLLVGAMGVRGPERKNLVPVDWVSEVITHILGQSQHHGKTFHLTAQRPTLIMDMAEVVQEAVETYSPMSDWSDPTHCDGTWFADNFRAEMDVYRAYWRDDPQFDLTNTMAAAPHLPCPTVDRPMLMNMARHAIQTNFGKPRPRPMRPEFDVQQHLLPILSNRRRLPAGVNGTAYLGLQVNGPGGGQWKLMLRGGDLVAAENGLSPQCSAIFQLNSHTFRRLASRQMTVPEAVEAGRVVIVGNGMEQHALEAVLQTAASGSLSVPQVAGRQHDR